MQPFPAHTRDSYLGDIYNSSEEEEVAKAGRKRRVGVGEEEDKGEDGQSP